MVSKRFAEPKSKGGGCLLTVRRLQITRLESVIVALSLSTSIAMERQNGVQSDGEESAAAHSRAEQVRIAFESLERQSGTCLQLFAIGAFLDLLDDLGLLLAVDTPPRKGHGFQPLRTDLAGAIFARAIRPVLQVT